MTYLQALQLTSLETAKLNDLNWRIRRLSDQYAAETDPATRKALKALGARLIAERDEIRGRK
jgi:hypothetical protein